MDQLHAHAQSPASFTPASDAGASRTPPTAETRASPRSCLACKAKKIRCDKTRPCQRCTRAGRSCAYPPPGPRVRRTKGAIMAAMASRLADLEAQLKEKGVPKSIGMAEKRVTHRQTQHASTRDTVTPGHTVDVLVERGSSSQYFNEVLLARVIGDDDDGRIGHSLSALASHTRPTNRSTLAIRLWHTYLDKVDGCSGLKLLHVPTDEVRVFSAIHDPDATSYDDLALCFAIYFAALVSLEEGEAALLLKGDGHLSISKTDMLQKLKLGLEQSLAHGDFLDRPTLTGLHALVIYLASLRFCNRGKGLWVLNGLAVRVAQSLGLHRDGQRLRRTTQRTLTPFEAEIRRRLWWHLLSRDGRASEDYGLDNMATLGSGSNLLAESDVQLPLNVDDADLVPDMETLPKEKAGWTAMTFSLIHIALYRTAQRLAALAAAATTSDDEPSSEDTRDRIMADLRADVEQRLGRCNPLLPQQQMTISCSRFLLRKLDFVSRLQWALLVGRGGAVELVTDANLVEALAILQPRLFHEDSLLLRYAWPPPGLPTVPHRHPHGPHVGDAWTALDTLFAHELNGAQTVASHESAATGFGAKFAVLAALKAKAETITGRTQAGTVQRVGTGSRSPTDTGQTILKSNTPFSGRVGAETANASSTALPSSGPPSGSLFGDDSVDLGLDLSSGLLDFGLDGMWSAWGDEQPPLL
ncbi:hypothetical protein SPBR_02438 [Sporothrix brasiliensis 5110]|uniref:Zn(2)-C6 fungal-type domain-containing protein n=1 Tax=Sporothrix brasiliensis 5110 TaxID=1398154 RepID=A0A0C2IUG9_9PEZI|nr:uncharacterized protein SPBR_02438 [Sporothrix brasiliensis 5110]KIH92786.1 hypothetical protein SPBR_02438 [Sporothrix brasiliensis 5110]